MLNNSYEKESDSNDNSLKKALVLIAISILSVFIIPISACFSVGFALGSVISLLVGILRTLGFKQIPLFVLSLQPPSFLSLPFALILSLICLAFAYISSIIFKKYLTFLKLKYSELKSVT